MRPGPGAAELERLIEEVVHGRLGLHQLPRELDAADAARVRRALAERHAGGELPHIGHFSFDPALAGSQNCENLIGAAQVPMGLAGPLLVRGEQCDGEVMVPLATTEGALIASINRGCRALSRAGGVTVRVEDVGMTRAPVFRTSGILESERFVRWLADHHERIRERAERDSRFLKLQEVRPVRLGATVFVRFRFTTGDAMGMNMATIACDRVVNELIEPETGVRCVALSGNVCVD